MVQCPFCHFNNEDGALFCEQCKSDLAAVAVTGEAAAVAAEAVPLEAEAVPVEAMPVEAVPVEAMPVEVVPLEATPLEATPVEAVPMEATPVEAEPVAAEAVPAEPVAPPAPAPAPAAPPAAAPPPLAAAAPAPPPPAPAPAAPAAPIPAGAEPRLVVMRGLKRNAEYPIYEGPNFVGRADEKPVDIDLEDQEPPDRIWSSRQHACIFFENGELAIEDLNSSNGTFVNRARIYPGQKKALSPNDVIQIGTVQLKVVV